MFPERFFFPKDPGFLQALRECQTAEEAAEIIRQYENRKQG